MKTIGLIGGMSVESSIKYYQVITKTVNNFLGKHHTAPLVLVSLDTEITIEAIHTDRWDDMRDLLIDAAKKLEAAQVDFIAIACNSMHKVAIEVKEHINTPFIHILDPVLKKLKEKEIKKIGILGTKFTMENDFYQRYLEKLQIESIIPDKTDRDEMHRIIFDELVLHEFKETSIKTLVEILHSVEKKGAEAIILGCTELPLVLSQNDAKTLVLDTTTLHAEALAYEALKPEIEALNK